MITSTFAPVVSLVPGREDQLPTRLSALRMPRWAGTLVFTVLFVYGVIGSVAGFVAMGDDGSSAVPTWGALTLLLTAPSAGIIGGVLLWYASEWVTLTEDEATVTRAFLYVSEADGHTTRDSAVYQNIGGADPAAAHG